MKIEGAFKVENGVIVPFNAVMEEYLFSELKEGDVFSGEMTINNRRGLRTKLQNAAMWLFNTKIAKALNAAGYDLKSFFNPEHTLPFSKDTVKEFIWDEISMALHNTKSSSKLDTKQFCEVGEAMGERLAMSKGISVDWPSRESLSYENQEA